MQSLLLVTAVLSGVFLIRVVGCQQLCYMYLIAIEHTASVLVQRSALSGIVPTLEESDPALITGKDRFFSMKPVPVHANYPFNLPPQEAMKQVAGGRQERGVALTQQQPVLERSPSI